MISDDVENLRRERGVIAAPSVEESFGAPQVLLVKYYSGGGGG